MGEMGVVWGQGQGPGQFSRAAVPIPTLPFKGQRILNLSLAFWVIGKSICQAGRPEHVSSELAGLMQCGPLFVCPQPAEVWGPRVYPVSEGMKPALRAHARLSRALWPRLATAALSVCASGRLKSTLRSFLTQSPILPLRMAHQGPSLGRNMLPRDIFRGGFIFAPQYFGESLLSSQPPPSREALC